MPEDAQCNIDFHYTALQVLYEKALRNEDEISAALAQLIVLSATLDNASSTLPQAIVTDVSKKFTDATTTAANKIIADHKAAISSAQNASQAFERAAKRAGLWAFASGTAAFALVILVTLGILYLYVPTPADISALRDEQASLQASIKHLKDAGALTKINRCPDNGKMRPCVKISVPDRNRLWGDGQYMIIDGY